MYAAASKVLIITRTDARIFEIPNASTQPIKAPMMASLIDCFNTSPVTARLVEPSAIRMPISLVRCETTYERTP